MSLALRLERVCAELPRRQAHRQFSVFDTREKRPDIRPELYEVARWYVCRTRARAEKQVDRLFTRSGIECYLPLVEQERQWADRKKRVAFPLFPGYTFARFDLSGIHAILKTPGVVTVVRTGGYPDPLPDDELESVRVLAEAASETGAVPYPVEFFQPGEEVIVISGPFEGMIGVLIETRGGSRVAVRLSAIRRATAVELNPTALRPLH